MFRTLTYQTTEDALVVTWWSSALFERQKFQRVYAIPKSMNPRPQDAAIPAVRPRPLNLSIPTYNLLKTQGQRSIETVDEERVEQRARSREEICTITPLSPTDSPHDGNTAASWMNSLHRRLSSLHRLLQIVACEGAQAHQGVRERARCRPRGDREARLYAYNRACGAVVCFGDAWNRIHPTLC